MIKWRRGSKFLHHHKPKPKQLSFAVDGSPPHKICQIPLTPQTVHSTLLNCHSDLIALTFFFWCARQKGYFHDRPAFHHMLHVVTRLNHRFGSVKQLLHHLKLAVGGFAINPHMILLLLRIYWHGGCNDLVFETFEEMLNLGYTPNTYARNILMDALFKTGLVTVALRVLKETQVPNFLTYSIAISNLCRLGDLVNLRHVLRTMLRSGYYPNAHTFPVLLNCFAKTGGVKAALELYGLMTTLGIPISVHTWTILINGFCKSGKLVMAGYLLQKMVDTGCPPNVVTCTCLIKAFMESHMPTHAFDIFKTMTSQGDSPDLLLCNVFIDCLSKMGNYDEALDLFVSLPKRNLIPDSFTFCSIISVVCLSQRFSLLPNLIHGLPVQADLVVCNFILNYLCKAGSPSCAVEFYNDMVDRGFLPDKYTYSGLLRGLCGAGRIREAVNVYRGILMHNHVVIDAHIHTVIIDGLIRSGDFQGAVKVFREATLKQYPLDVVSYTIAVSGLVKAGRSQEAYALYCQMKECGIAPNAKICSVLISGFYRERNVEKAQQILDEMIDAGMESRLQ